MSDSHFAGADRAAGYGVEEEEAPQDNAHAATATREEETRPLEAHQPVAELTDVDVPSQRASALALSPVAVLTGSDADTAFDVGNMRAQEGMRGILARLGLKVAPSAKEQAALEAEVVHTRNEEIIRQATYTRPVGVLVANQKGSAGKTSTAVTLGGQLATCRGGSVAIIEVAEDPGSLSLRAEGTPRRGIGELVQDSESITSAAQLDGYTAPQTSYARVIASTGPRAPLTAAAVTAAARLVDEYFSIRVMDSGNQYTSPAFKSAVRAADVLVVPIVNAIDATFAALSLLDHLRAQGGHAADLANRAIVLRLADGRPEMPEVVARVDAALEQAHIGAVLSIPFDPHIAERGEITLSQLQPATRRALTAASAAVIRSLDHINP